MTISTDILVTAIAAPCTAVVTYLIARWRMSNSISKSIGSLQSEIKGFKDTCEARFKGLGDVVAANMKSYEIRLSSFEDRFERLEDRIDRKINGIKKPVRRRRKVSSDG